MCVHIVVYVFRIVSTDKIVPFINTLVIIIIINNLSASPSHAAVVPLFPAGGRDAWRADGIQRDVAQAVECKGRCVETTSSGASHAPWACTFGLFVCQHSSAKKPQVHSVLGEVVVSATISPHAVVHTSAVLPTTLAAVLRLQGFQ